MCKCTISSRLVSEARLNITKTSFNQEPHNNRLIEVKLSYAGLFFTQLPQQLLLYGSCSSYVEIVTQGYYIYQISDFFLKVFTVDVSETTFYQKFQLYSTYSAIIFRQCHACFFHGIIFLVFEFNLYLIAFEWFILVLRNNFCYILSDDRIQCFSSSIVIKLQKIVTKLAYLM